MALNALRRFCPEGTTHCVVEERLHRGAPVYAVVAIVPEGASVSINGYSSRELAESTAQGINDLLRDERLVPLTVNALEESLEMRRKA